MTQLSGYGAYKLFLAIKAHFSDKNYDFFKFQGKTNATKDSYLARNDKQFFETVSRRYNAQELRDLYVSNILMDRLYITDMIEEESNNILFEYRGRRQSLSYVFENELDKLFAKGVKSSIETHVGEYPKLLIMCMRYQVSFETMVILNDFVNYSSKYDEMIGESDILWSNIRRKIICYKPFLKYDKKKFSKILKEKIVDGQDKTPEKISAEETSY